MARLKMCKFKGLKLALIDKQMKSLIKLFWIKGRINRLEYTISMIVIFSIIIGISNNNNGSLTDWGCLLFYPYITQAGKRCQDRGLPWYKILLSPVNFLFNFSDRSENGGNKYGEVPVTIFYK